MYAQIPFEVPSRASAPPHPPPNKLFPSPLLSHICALLLLRPLPPLLPRPPLSPFPATLTQKHRGGWANHLANSPSQNGTNLRPVLVACRWALVAFPRGTVHTASPLHSALTKNTGEEGGPNQLALATGHRLFTNHQSPITNHPLR